MYLRKYSHILGFKITVYKHILEKCEFIKKEMFYIILIIHLQMRAQYAPFAFLETLQEKQ